MGQNCRIRCHQRCAGLPSGRLKLVRAFIREGYDGDVSRRRITFHASDGLADVRAAGTQIHKHKHGTFLPRIIGKLTRIRDGEDSIMKVLEPVYQLAAGHQVFVQDKRQRLGHMQTVERFGSNCKAIPGPASRRIVTALSIVNLPARCPHIGNGP